MSNILRLMAILVFLTGFGAGCQREEKSVTKNIVVADPKPVVADVKKPAAAKDVKATDRSKIVGRIVWGADKAPQQANLNLGNNAAGCPAAIKDQQWVVDPKTLGLKDAFVWLEPATKGEKMPAAENVKLPERAEVDQPACMFVPHALALREGQILVAKNTSAIPHNFKWTGNPTANPGGNELIPPGGSIEIKNLVADRLPVAVECNIHPWMRGWIRVYDHPYFAVTNANGEFTIENAPVGNFRLKIWHGSGGWPLGAKGREGQPIAVLAGETVVGNVTYPPPPND